MTLALPDFSTAQVLVAGDVMLDRYWSGSTSRISPEAPVQVVRIRNDEVRAGGAANVALNIASLGGRVRLLGVVGVDDAARQLREAVLAHGVQPEFVETAGYPTISKLRVLSRNQQLLRLDFEEALVEGGEFDHGAWLERYRASLGDTRVVVLSDYGKGTLSRVASMVQTARADGRYVLVDPKGTDWKRYRGATLLTPNLSEFEAVAGVCKDDADLERRAEALRAELSLDALLITRSERGMTLIRTGHKPLHIPATAREVYDVTGAGDTVIAVLAAGLASGLDLASACRLSNLAAGIVVTKIGTASVSPAELAQALAGQPAQRSVLEENALLDVLADARRRGQRIVMTNGCFDLLHVGHVRYLQAAKALGDRLVVAVNDDDSVRRLKGPTRPLNTGADRMAMLAALECVDWVVPFTEDTPARLIGRALPDILVKGGDYQPEQIAGFDAVTANGGEVRVLEFHEGYSTTRLI
ncbi:MAG TPA: bifunctional D-glycero-beta-D-manno-heptose-7-phosphate kinase/D-glycero-beta-D-manno-heptose 1-phosphate adenylyltransferase HldE, partial [Solimonas sp.]